MRKLNALQKIKLTLNKFDLIIHELITEKSESNYNVDINQYFNNRPIENAKYEYLLKNIREIYSNTASMLTHISAMIAVMGILLLIFQDSPVTKFVIFIEMIAYSFFASACIYCIRWNQPESNRETEIRTDPMKSCYIRYKRHKYIYSKCTNGVFYTTIVFIFTLIGHLIVTLIIQ